MIKNIAHSVQNRLLNLSKSSGVGHQQIVTRYFQERLLSRLSHSRFVGNFILKGGALLYAHNRDSARPTLDLDFMGEHISREKDTMMSAFKEIYNIDEVDGVTFVSDTLTTDDIAVEKRYPGVRISILATLGSIRQVVSMDIGFGDVIVPSPVDLEYPVMLEEDSNILIKAYSIETVIAEKIQTMVDRYVRNSRMKDFYDVWSLLKGNRINKVVLKEAIQATFTNRATPIESLSIIFDEEFVNNRDMDLRWKAYLRKTKLELPSFPEVMTSIKSILTNELE